MVTLATLPLSTVPVTVMLSDSVVFSSRVVRTASAIAGSAPPAGRRKRQTPKPNAAAARTADTRSTRFLVNRNDRSLYRAFPLRPPEKARQHRRGRGSHLQLGRCLGAGQAVQREQCIQQVPDGHRACKDVFHAPKRSFRAGGLARENKNVYTQYKEKETGESDGAEIIGLKPKRRFSACQKIRQPKRKDLGIY